MITLGILGIPIVLSMFRLNTIKWTLGQRVLAILIFLWWCNCTFNIVKKKNKDAYSLYGYSNQDCASALTKDKQSDV